MPILLLFAQLAAADVDVRVGAGILDVGQLYVGVAPTPKWEGHATVGTNLGLLTWFTAGLGGVWRPHEWGGGGPHHFALGLGPDLWAGPTSDRVAVIAAATFDLRYAYRPVGAKIGFVAASRWSFGATTDLSFVGAPTDRLEPAIMFQALQLGVTF